jgi:5-methylcytosine-specific restriction endonuclease McrA
MDNDKLARVVAEARRAREERERGYRERALKILPAICARCGRDFEGRRLRELTVHHRDGNHDHNPPDGSNWELLCIYCHENEHARELDEAARGKRPAGEGEVAAATHQPFADLAKRLKGKDR